MMRKTDKGFSMIELMLGAAILTLVIVASLLTFLSSMFLNDSSRNLATAANDAQYALEQIKAQSFTNIQTYLSSYPSTQFNNLPSENITFPNPLYTSTLDAITVQITWNERNATRTFSITSLFAQ